jgi:hypothetical protein
MLAETINPLAFAAGIAALVGLSGLLYGATGKVQSRANFGLRLLQGGMTLAGLLLIAGAFIFGPETDLFGGILLLALGMGTTAIKSPS